MTLLNDLKLNNQDLSQWGVVMPSDMADTMALAQEGQKMRVSGVRLVDGRFVLRAEALVETQWFQSGLDQIDWMQCQCFLWPQCLGLIDRYTENEFGTMPQPPEWVQIEGAGLGPVGAVDGWPVGAHVMKDGFVWVSRAPNNVNEPLVNITSTWSRKDGTFVVPAGWQYQIGEEVTEDGGATWYRVTQATSFPPSASPSQYVAIDGPGGDILPQTEEWSAGVAYATGDVVTYSGASYTCLQGHTSQAGWEPPNVASLWAGI